MSLSVNPNQTEPKVKYIVVKPKESVAPKIFTTLGVAVGALASVNIVKSVNSAELLDVFVGKKSRLGMNTGIVGVVTAGIGMIGLAFGNIISFCTKNSRRKKAEEEYDLITNMVKKQ